MNNFTIKLLTQHWNDNEPDTGDDLCSHGKISLSIDDIVLSNNNSVDWTVASAAVRLMKSAVHGYDSKFELEMIPCCGYLRLFPSSPEYITWDTTINNDTIIISNIRYAKKGENELNMISDSFYIEYKSYALQVLKFAESVKTFYSSSLPRKFYDKWALEEFTEFWKEFHETYKLLFDKIRQSELLSI